MDIRVICAWCHVVLHEGDAPEPVSHGICAACEDRVWHREQLVEIDDEFKAAASELEDNT